MANSCKECGYPLQGNEVACPECGCLIEQPVQQQSQQEWSIPTKEPQSQGQYNYSAPATEQTDRAQYVYECGVIAWETFKKYACFEGRASRREYWSFWVIAVLPLSFPFSLLIVLLPWIGVSIRRMHDIGKSGWWALIPIVSLFLLLKRSDEGDNGYGEPHPAKNLL